MNAWGRNPQTKESLILAARNVLLFKPSGVLRERNLTKKGL